jgi:hypothetical protein
MKYKKELLSQQLASQQEKIMMSIQSITTELAETFLPIIKIYRIKHNKLKE